MPPLKKHKKIDEYFNEEWRLKCKDVASMQNKARADARFTDVQFVVGIEENRKEFPAHKLILACASPVFEKMFYGGLAEKRDIIETDDDPEAFEMLLDYVYGNVKIRSPFAAWKLFTIGDKYLVPNVEDDTKEYMKSVKMDEHALWEIIENNMFFIPFFEDKVNSYVTENTKDLLKSEKFMDVPEDIVCHILKLDKLNDDEYNLLYAVTKWAYRNLKDVNSKKLINFYQYIRFSTLRITDFYKFIGIYPTAISTNNSLQILQHLNDPAMCDLPKWCLSSRFKRNAEFEDYRLTQKLVEDIFQRPYYDSDDFD